MATRRVKGSRARVKAVAIELPRAPRLDARRLVPSIRSLAVGFALIALALASYGAARESPLFAIRHVDVVGAPPDVRARVAAALAPLEGDSLVGLRAEEVDRRVAALPDVAGVTYDRAFPHTLRVVVSPERPLVVLRRGRSSWLVSARGRVVRAVRRGARGELPRVWVPRDVAVDPGDTLGDAAAVRAVRVIALAVPRIQVGIRTARIDGPETTLILRNGIEVRLGREYDLALKLAVAARVLPLLDAESTYVDVAVPDRPVADGAARPQPEVDGSLP